MHFALGPGREERGSRYLIRNHPDAALLPLGGRLDVVPRHDVDQEVDLVVLGDGHGDVVPLECAPLVVLEIYSWPDCFVNQLGIHCTAHSVPSVHFRV